jgi:hypothetical protein
MIPFIDDHRGAYGVEPICKVLPIAPSTYRAHAGRRADLAKLPPRAQRDLALTAKIQRVFDANFGVYGVRKVWRQLGREGKEVARCTVARLMRKMGLQGVVRGREVRTRCGCRTLPGRLHYRRLCPTHRWLARQPHSSRRPVLDALEQALVDRRPVQGGGLSTTATAASNILVVATPNVSPRQGSSPPSAASATATTTPWPKASTASTKPR